MHAMAHCVDRRRFYLCGAMGAEARFLGSLILGSSIEGALSPVRIFLLKAG